MTSDGGAPAISVRGLGKFYRLGSRESYRTLRETLTASALAPFRALAGSGRRGSSNGETHGGVWALRDTSFDVRRGEVVGIIGRNGAGKSTLLKILSRVTEPTEGSAEIRGRVGALLEVGTGFHPELTGRENVYLSGAILGMTRAEIDESFDEVVSFAEVERFVDTPVKRYSSGMYVRLAFSVAAHLEPDVLIVDEVLAVGDAAFRERCWGRLAEVSGQGRTILLVSHDMDAVLRLCDRVILLEKGCVAADDAPHAAVSRYLSEVTSRSLAARRSVSLREHPGRQKPFDGVVRLTHCRVTSGDQQGTGSVATGGECRIILGYVAAFPLTAKRVNFVVVFRGDTSVRLGSCWSTSTLSESDDLGSAGEVECHIRQVPFLPGRYFLDVGCQVASAWSDFVYEAGTLEIAPGPLHPSAQLPARGWGQCLVKHSWCKLE